MRTRSLFLAAGGFVFLVMNAAGCGGGGGGGIGGGGVIPQYSGKTTQAALGSTTEGGQFGSAIVVTSMSGAFSTVATGTAASATALRPSVRTSVVASARRSSTLPRTRGAFPMGVGTDVVPGAEGGSMTITVTWDDLTHNITRIHAVFNSFDDVADGIRNPLDGSLDMIPTTWNALGDPVVYIASFDDLRETEPGGSVTHYSGGTVTVDETDPNRVIVTSKYLIVDGATKIEVWRNELTEVTVPENPAVFPPTYLTTVSGKIYVSNLGYVDVTAVDALVFPPGRDYPTGGRLLLTGEGGKTARVTLQRLLPEVQIEADTNGDGAFDQTAHIGWEDLVSGWTFALPVVSVLYAGPSPSDIAVEAGSVFFSDSSDFPLKKVPSVGGPVQPLVTKFSGQQMGDLAVRDGFIYWVQHRIFGSSWALYKSSADGKTTTVHYVATDGNYGGYSAKTIATDNAAVYALRTTLWPLSTVVLRIPLAGGEAVPLATTGNVVWGAASDGSFLYWVEAPLTGGAGNAAIYKVPVGGGPAEPLLTGFSFAENTDNQGFVLDGNELFYTDSAFPSNRVRKISTSGGVPVTVAEFPEFPFRLAVGPTHVVWMTSPQNTVAAAPRGGGATIPLATIPFESYPVDVVVVGGTACWIEKTNLVLGGTLKSASVTGGPAQTLATGLNDPVAMATDGAAIDVVENSYEGETSFQVLAGRISRVPLAGGPATVVVSGILADNPPFEVANGEIFLADTRTVKKIAAGGGAPAVLDNVLAVYYSTGVGSTLATDGTHVYSIDALNRLRRVPVGGGAAEVIATLPMYTFGVPRLIRLSGEYVYWRDVDGIRRIPKSGGAPEPVIVPIATPSDFAVDGSYVYYAESVLRRVPVAGGSSEIFLNRPVTNVLLDGTTIYWLSGRVIGKVPAAGGQWSILYESNPAGSPALAPSLAVDANHVYWVDPAGGEIVRTAK